MRSGTPPPPPWRSGASPPGSPRRGRSVVRPLPVHTVLFPGAASRDSILLLSCRGYDTDGELVAFCD
ncbi:MAG: hypothetical protein ACLRNQ_04015 [Flavonifractor plautii]